MAQFDIKVRSELVAARFNNYLQELWAIDPTIEFSDLLHAEAASVAAGALTRTRAASVAGIKRNFAEKEWTTFGGKKYKLSNHYPDELWGQISDFRKTRLALRLGARGISKQSWYNLGQKVKAGIVRAPGYVVAANFRGRQYPEDVSSLDESTPAGYFLTIFNNSPIVQFANGRWALLGAMQGRVSYFCRNMKHRAFQTYESRARKYPGIWVTEAAA